MEERVDEHAGTLPTILFMIGSLRKQSFNRQLAEFAQTTFGDRANIEILDWKDVPIFNQDEEFPTPEAVAKAREAVTKADALWMFTPEYNHGVSGAFKNLIDWLSRPLGPDTPAVINGKMVTVSGVGGYNVVRDSFADLIPTLEFLKMNMVPATFTGIAVEGEEWVTNELSLNDFEKDAIRNQTETLLTSIAQNQ